MKIKFISFIDENNINVLPESKEAVFDKLSPLGKQENKAEICRMQNELLQKLGDSFQKDTVTVLAIDISQFIKTKSLLFKAMSIKCVRNEEIIEKIKSDANLSYLNEKQIAAQSAIPMHSEAFVTKDGLFSGFGLKSDRQIFVVVPLDENRADEEFAETVYNFVVSGVDFDEEDSQDNEDNESEINNDSEQEPVEEISQENEAGIFLTPIEEQVEKIDVEQFGTVMYETEQDQPLFGSGGVDDLVAETFANIGNSKIKIAFGVQDDNVVVDEFLRSKIVFKNNSVFTIANVGKTCIEETEQKNKESLSHVARSAMLNANATIGMAVSDVLTDNHGKKYVLSAMCDARKTNIYKIFALPDEKDEDIIISAIGNMFSVLNDRVMEYNDRKLQKKEEVKEHNVKKKKSKAGLILFIVLFVLLLAAVGVAAYGYFTGSGAIYDLIERVKDMLLSRT